MFRCLSPFMIGIHISLEQLVWAELSWNPFQKRIASICFGPNHLGKKQVTLTARSSKCSVTAALLSLLVRKANFSGEIENNFFFKSKFCPQNFFRIGLVQNKLKLYIFEMDFMTIQLKLTVPKKCGFWSRKGSNIWTLFYWPYNAVNPSPRIISLTPKKGDV